MSDAHPEIVIIRRGGHGDHDEHHGGVWKIAFADFMTAMMAFFLVLWLISANDKTRASVARYFNPVKLVDATTRPRGLHDVKKDDSGITATPDTKDNVADKTAKDSPPSPKAPPTAESPRGREKRLDKELRDNPYLALAEIVGDKGPGEDPASEKTEQDPGIGRGGVAFRDPFAPPPQAHTANDEKANASAPPDATPPAESKAAPPPQDQTNSPETDAAKARANDLKQTVAATLGANAADRAGPMIDVRATPEGTLLVLTDTPNFAMFASGSAVPSKRVVQMMAKIAHLIKDKPGQIVLRGYTDNKKFRSTRYDNWHLSLDRAQVAHYMLVRGGLSDERISHVEGYADHQAGSGIDPASSNSRRIEILLKDRS